nr:helix-turn-helix transcriptional regulator [Eggerthella sinensis]
MIGTNQTYLWRIEKGTTNVGIDLLYRIAKGLDVRVRDLIDF